MLLFLVQVIQFLTYIQKFLILLDTWLIPTHMQNSSRFGTFMFIFNIITVCTQDTLFFALCRSLRLLFDIFTSDTDLQRISSVSGDAQLQILTFELQLNYLRNMLTYYANCRSSCAKHAKKNLSPCAFSVAGPKIWNSFSVLVRPGNVQM